jgi:hypothetical protein
MPAVARSVDCIWHRSAIADLVDGFRAQMVSVDPVRTRENMLSLMTDAARKRAHPAIEALRNAPKGDGALLTPEDRARIEENERRGRKGVPHETVEAILAERERNGG